MIFSNKSLDKSSSVPLYCQLQSIIADTIKDNKIKEGDMLPTEIELSNIFDVSRPTVRMALNNLVNKGYLKRIKGKGTFVTKPKIYQEYTRFIESYNEEMKKKGLIPKTKVLEKLVMEADELIAGKLNVSEGEKIIKLKRLRFATRVDEDEIIYDHKPVLVTTVYTVYNLLPTLMNYDFEVFSFYEVLDKNNLSVKKAIREIEAKNADAETASLLQINEGDAVHVITSTGFLENGVPIEYSESIYPGERNKFIIEISR